MEQDKIDFNIKLELSDYKKIAYWLFGISILGHLLSIPIVSLFAFVVNIVAGRFKNLGDALITALIVTLLMVVFVLYKIVKGLFEVRKFHREYFESNKLIQKERNYSFNSDGLTISSETSNQFIKWDEFYSIVENKYEIVLFISKIQFFIIPKRCLKDLGELDILKHIIRSNFKKDKLKLSNK